jgi:threonine dehydrogenase-like Zn-dependent dehydrogenase
MDEMNCTKCPAEMDLKQAAFWNLAHTGIYALRRSGCKWENLALFWDRDFVGAITAQCAKVAGAVPVIVTDINNSRLEAARKNGN